MVAIDGEEEREESRQGKIESEVGEVKEEEKDKVCGKSGTTKRGRF